MPSPLPRKIDLCFVVVHIKYVQEKRMREEAECEDDDPTPEGMWDTDTDTIWVLKRQSRRKMRNVILHELVHAALDLRDGDVR
jgi:hypothetical protein